DRGSYLHRADEWRHENAGRRPLSATTLRADWVHRADGCGECSVARANLQRGLFDFHGRIQIVDGRATLERMEYQPKQREIPGRTQRGAYSLDGAGTEAEMGFQSWRCDDRTITTHDCRWARIHRSCHGSRLFARRRDGMHALGIQS